MNFKKHCELGELFGIKTCLKEVGGAFNAELKGQVNRKRRRDGSSILPGGIFSRASVLHLGVHPSFL